MTQHELDIAWKDRHNRWARIRETRQQLSWVVHNLPATFDALAYELPFQRSRGKQGTSSQECTLQAIGAYLSLSAFAGFEPTPVYPISTKAAFGCTKLSGKQPVINAVNERFGLDLRDDQDAEADAIGVALAAHKILAERQTKCLQPKLRLRKATVKWQTQNKHR